jgi:hypothetical protein
VLSPYSNLAGELPSYLFFALAAFLVVFVALLAVFSGGRFVSAMNALRALSVSFLTAPARYLRAVVSTLIARSQIDEQQQADSRQYLLGKLILLANAGLLLTTAGILAAGLVGSWIALYPPEQRMARRTLSEQIAEQEKAVADAKTKLASFQELADSKHEQDTLADLTKRESESRSSLEQATGRVRDDIRAAADLARIEDYLRQAAIRSANEVPRAAEQINRFITNEVQDPQAKELLAGWCTSWQSWANARIALNEQTSRLSEARAQVNTQRQFADLQARSLAALKAEYAGLPMVLSPSNLLSSLKILFYVLFLAFAWVWICGFCIESAGLFIDLAENVRLVRAGVERRGPPMFQQFVA